MRGLRLGTPECAEAQLRVNEGMISIADPLPKMLRWIRKRGDPANRTGTTIRFLGDTFDPMQTVLLSDEGVSTVHPAAITAFDAVSVPQSTPALRPRGTDLALSHRLLGRCRPPRQHLIPTALIHSSFSLTFTDHGSQSVHRATTTAYPVPRCPTPDVLRRSVKRTDQPHTKSQLILADQ